MTDRELLELAAKAAGYSIRFHQGVCKGGAYEGCERLWPDGEWRPWRPREDDGDALRLAVKLKMKLWHSDCGAYADHESLPEDMRPCREDARNDRNAATRRTIVRAAAEIQRQREASK